MFLCSIKVPLKTLQTRLPDFKAPSLFVVNKEVSKPCIAMHQVFRGLLLNTQSSVFWQPTARNSSVCPEVYANIIDFRSVSLSLSFEDK